MKALDGLLESTDKAASAVPIMMIAGTPGVGKTTLAVRWAHYVADRFPDGQLYVNLRGFDPSDAPVPPGEAIRGFLDALGVAAGHIPGTLEAQAGLYRSLLASRRMLVVLDNARDADQVRPLLPGNPACLVVVTSRSQLAGLIAASDARLLSLDVLTSADAQEMLARRLGSARLAGEPPAAEELIELCARLPLALAIVAAWAAASPALGLDELADDLRVTARRLDAMDTGEAATSLRAVFSWSYQLLTDSAARVFRLLGLHPGPDITVAATASLAAIPRDEARTLLRELARCNLVTEHARGRFAFHDMLRAYAAEQAVAREGPAECRATVRRLLDHYLRTGLTTARLLDPTRNTITLPAAAPGVLPEEPESYREAWAWLEAENAVLLAAINQAAHNGFDAHAWQMPWSVETFFSRQGRWHDMVGVNHTALQAAVRLGDIAGQAYTHSGLGRAYALLGMADDAEKHLSLALELFEQVPEEQTGKARTHINMGTAFGRQRRFDEAIRHAERARDLYRDAGHKAGFAGATNNIGWYTYHLGFYEQALVLCEESLAAFREVGSLFGAAHATDSLACAHLGLGHHEQAFSLLREAHEVFIEIGDRLNQAEILRHLGEALASGGDHDAARDTWQQALQVLEELGHSDAELVRAELQRLDAEDQASVS
jgi:tetratricopeptide (TPR) repeat protein